MDVIDKMSLSYLFKDWFKPINKEGLNHDSLSKIFGRFAIAPCYRDYILTICNSEEIPSFLSCI